MVRAWSHVLLYAPPPPGCYVHSGCRAEPDQGSYLETTITSDVSNCCSRCRSFYPLYQNTQQVITPLCLGWSYQSATGICSTLRYSCNATDCVANLALILSAGRFAESNGSVCGFPMAGAVEIGVQYLPNNITAVTQPSITTPYMCQATCDVKSAQCAGWTFDMATSNCTMLPWGGQMGKEITFAMQPDYISGFSTTLLPMPDSYDVDGEMPTCTLVYTQHWFVCEVFDPLLYVLFVGRGLLWFAVVA